MLEMLRPDLNSFDNLGNHLKDICVRRIMFQNSWHGLQRLKIIDYYDPITTNLNFQQRIASTKSPTDILQLSWNYAKIFSWVDSSGDTFLAALIKYWRADVDELALAGLLSELLEKGADIHTRDRQGNTPLANAVRLGSRPAVAVLLKANSNIHIRDYNGNGIMSQARACLKQARRKEDDKRYAMILSCMNAMVDAGAIANPTERDELLTPIARARGENQSWAIFQRDDIGPLSKPSGGVQDSR
jgi:hypothetical protein